MYFHTVVLNQFFLERDYLGGIHLFAKYWKSSCLDNATLFKIDIKAQRKDKLGEFRTIYTLVGIRCYITICLNPSSHEWVTNFLSVPLQCFPDLSWQSMIKIEGTGATSTILFLLFLDFSLNLEFSLKCIHVSKMYAGNNFHTWRNMRTVTKVIEKE